MHEYRKVVIPACLKRESGILLKKTISPTEHFGDDIDSCNHLIVKFIMIVLLVLFASESACAASLSIDMGRQSAGFGIGTDFNFGYGLIGLSAKFTTDAPWSYVQTEETLIGPCEDFNTKSGSENELRKKCTQEGKFHDGDEWEVFGKVGFRLPLVSSIYLNSGLGLSAQKTAQLYVFSEEYCTYRADGECIQKVEYGETWGQVDKDYFMTFLGGISVEMNRRLIINFDYHSRKGLIAGLLWRY